MANDSGKKPAIRTKKHVARLERERQQSRIILFAFVGILTAVVLLLIYGYLDINYFQLQKPVAKVGNTEITVSQFEARVRLQRQQLLSQYNQYQQYSQLFGLDVQTQLTQLETQLNTPETIGQSILDQMINEQLTRQEAAKRGITVSAEELNVEKQNSFAYFPNGSPTPTVTPTEVILPQVPAEAYKIVTITPIPTATLEFTATPQITAIVELPASSTATTGTPQATATTQPSATPTATLEPPSPTATQGPTATASPTATPFTLEGYQTQFKNAQVRLQKLGLSEKDFLAFFDIQVLDRKLRDQITAQVPHVEKQIWARHILVADEASALKVIDRLKKGEDFAVLAKELSTDTGSAKNGGDLGWFGSGAMVAEFETAAFALQNPGDYTTTPVKTSFGYHIIQLIAKQDRPLTAQQYDAAKNKAFTDWLAAARKEYNVQTFDIWKQFVPSEPNFTTIATDAVIAATETAKATAKP